MASKSLLGQTIGKYRIVENLGRGGMAEVYKAYQSNLDRYVAIKIMHSFLADEEDFLSRFQREAKAMGSLNHGNIVGVYDFDIQDGSYYIVMEFVSGGTLKQKLETLAARGERLQMAQAVRIVLEIADALAYAHSRGMVHRDIKPANIMLSEDGRAILTDFGIAKILSGPSYTATGAMIGTPAYMSPEQGLGQPGDERSDLYALGVLFFQMATGRLPFDADTPLAVIMKHVNEPVPPPATINTELPVEIHNVILRALAKDPEERYQSAHEMARDLRTAIRSDGQHLATELPAELLQDRPTPPPTHRSPLTTGAEATTVSPAATVVAQRDKTKVAAPSAIAETEIGGPIVPPVKKRGRGWIIGLGLVALIIVIGGGVVFALNALSPEPTPTVPAVVVQPSPAATPTSTATAEPTLEGEPTATIDIQGTAEAIVAAALTAVATDTPRPTTTAMPTPSVTPDLTATFEASCEIGVELVRSYSYRNTSFNSAPVGATFPYNWVILNSGTCTLAAGLAWTYVEGEEFDQQGPVVLEEELAPGEETTFTASFVAPSTPATYESTWQFFDEDGNPVADPIDFSVLIYIPSTPTPSPTPTPAVTPTPTGEITPVGFNFFADSNCEYPGGGIEWRCEMLITPFGGGGGPYTVWVFDAEPPARYGPGGTVVHFIKAVRCFPWIHEVRVQDEVTGQSFSENVFVDPTLLTSFPTGGCVVAP